MQNIRMTARILCFNAQNALLLITGASGKNWVTPGGTVEPGEDLRAAAAREAEEEAGVRVRIDRLLHVQDLLTPSERVMEFFFLAEALPGERTQGNWQVQDPDGPVRTAAWLTADELQASGRPFLPAALQAVYAQRHAHSAGPDPFLGQQVKG